MYRCVPGDVPPEWRWFYVNDDGSCRVGLEPMRILPPSFRLLPPARIARFPRLAANDMPSRLEWSDGKTLTSVKEVECPKTGTWGRPMAALSVRRSGELLVMPDFHENARRARARARVDVVVRADRGEPARLELELQQRNAADQWIHAGSARTNGVSEESLTLEAAGWVEPNVEIRAVLTSSAVDGSMTTVLLSGAELFVPNCLPNQAGDACL
jgi:hypothetical protein